MCEIDGTILLPLAKKVLNKCANKKEFFTPKKIFFEPHSVTIKCSKRSNLCSCEFFLLFNCFKI